MHDFEKTRKYANHKSGAEAGTVETFSRRIYLNIYFSLARQNADKAAHDTKETLEAELKLKSWISNTPLYLQLQWFDTIESVNVSVKLKNRRRTTEMTSRDALYLEKLGVTPPNVLSKKPCNIKLLIV